MNPDFPRRSAPLGLYNRLSPFSLPAISPSAHQGNSMPVSALRRAALSVIAVLGLVTPLSTAVLARGVSDLTKEGLPNIQSQTALVIDLSTDAVLYERDADVVRPIASVSKLVGAMVVVEQCKLEMSALHEMSIANRDAAKGGDKSKLTTGWSYSHQDLLHAALMRSDNRALPALGEACGWDPTTMGQKMTEKARALGLKVTTFKEPNGLSQENVSTAREVMTFLKAAIRVPELVEIMTTTEYEIVAHKNGKTRPIKIRNTDRALSKGLASILGGKTGYTDPARYCLAIAARTTGGREVGMVFLGAEGRFTRFADFTRVLKWVEPPVLAAPKAPPTDAEVATSTPASGGAASAAKDGTGTAPAGGAVPVSAPPTGSGVTNSTSTAAESDGVGTSAASAEPVPTYKW
jgi:D-alanyl-D-alanine endopeptidase (penicillin-binding protein 7)